jgi:hypothetical protein
MKKTVMLQRYVQKKIHELKRIRDAIDSGVSTLGSATCIISWTSQA